MQNSYISIDSENKVNNIVLFDSTEPEINFDGVQYYLNSNNLQIGQSFDYSFYETVRQALDGRLADTDFWELPSVQSSVTNGQELIDYRLSIRQLRLSLTEENFMEVYDAMPEKPTANWSV